MAVFTMRSHPAPRLSVIIPSRDGVAGGNVPRLLAALNRQEGIEAAEVLLVVGERPNGHARNVGVEASRGSYLVFMDDDAGLLGTRNLVSLLAPFESAPGGGPIGLAGSATVIPEDSNRFQRRLARAVPRSVFPPVDRLTDTDMAHHLCCALPRRVYEEIGRESDTLETGTDVDLRHRLRRAGYRIVVVPGAVAAHPPPATLGDFWRKHAWYGSGKVELDRLYPPAPSNTIRGGWIGWAIYVARAWATFPLRTLRLDRASSFGWNPLVAVADLAQKTGYARAWRRARRGLPMGPSGGRFSSAGLAALLRPAPPGSARPPRPDEVRRLLLVATAGMGDAVAMLPLAHALRRHYPRARLTIWVARAGAAKVFAPAGVADRIFRLDLAARGRLGRVARKLVALARLRGGRFDLGVVNYVNSNAETGVLLRLGGVRRRAGYADSLTEPSLFDLVALRPEVLAGRRAAARHLDLLPVLGIEAGDAGVPRYIPGPAARSEAAARLAAAGQDRPGPVAGMHPGCGPGMSWKRWPIERFAALADRLADQGLRVWIFGGPEEEALAAELRGRLRHPATIWSQVADLEVTAALMERCAVFVSNDSGLYNLALALPVPVVALFGPSPETVSGPWATGRPALVLTHRVPCHPCYDYLRPPVALPCPIDRACLTGVSVEEAHAACLAVLGVTHVEDSVAAAAGARP